MNSGVWTSTWRTWTIPWGETTTSQRRTSATQFRPPLKKKRRCAWRYTEAEAAERCNCAPSELCPGPMAAIDEGDKIRTIYDGSWGGANAHIQNNTTEKTTSPTVMDCVQAIQWLIKSQKDPGATVAHGTGHAWSPPLRDVTWAVESGCHEGTSACSSYHGRLEIPSSPDQC